MTDRTMSPVRHNRLVRVARLYYLCGMTHQQIADREGLSRIKVTRLLKEAVGRKIVRFQIEDPAVQSLEMEDSLQRRFGLKEAIVAPTPQEASGLYDILGRFAADYLHRRIRDGMIVGLGWGRTLNGMLSHLRPLPGADLTVVSLTGGLAANANQPNPYDVVSAAAERLRAAPAYPLVPAIVHTAEAKAVLLREKKVREILALWRRLDIALMSIGAVAPETGFYYSFPNPEREVERVRKLGAVGDLLGKPFDIQGRPVRASWLHRTLAIAFETLAKVPLVVGIAGGEAKVPAILGVLRSGALNVLITDERAAERVLRLSEKTQEY